MLEEVLLVDDLAVEDVLLEEDVVIRLRASPHRNPHLVRSNGRRFALAVLDFDRLLDLRRLWELADEVPRKGFRNRPALLAGPAVRLVLQRAVVLLKPLAGR